MAVTIFRVKASDIRGKRWDSSAYINFNSNNSKLNKYDTYLLMNLVDFKNKSVKTSEQIYIGLENINSEDGKFIGELIPRNFSSANTFKINQILFSKLRPYLNKIGIAEFDGVCSTEFHVLEVIDKNQLNSKFLVHYLRLDNTCKYLTNLMSGHTLPRLQRESIENLQIPLPPMDIQKEIVQLMDEAYTTKKQLESEADELLKSINPYIMDKLGIEQVPLENAEQRQKWFTVKSSDIKGKRWDSFYQEFLLLQQFTTPFKKYNLSDIAYMEKGVTYDKDDEKSSGHGILRAGNITLESNQINFDDLVYIDNSVVFSQEKKLRKDDIFICTNSGSKKHVGKVAYSCEDTDCYFGGFMGVLRTLNKDKSHPLFLFHFLTIQHIRNSIGLLIANTTINNINFSDIAELQIPLPPMEIQKEIAHECETRRSAALQKQELAKSILDDAKAKVEAMLFGE